MSGMQELGESQLAILNVLWTKKQATVREIMEALPPERRASYGVIFSNLCNLEKQDLIARTRPPGTKVYTYRPIASSHDAISDILHDVLGRLFAGSPAMLIKHLIQTEGFSLAEIREIRLAVEQQESVILAKRQPAQT